MLDEINDVDDEGYVPTDLTQDRIEGRFQQGYELMLKRREMAEIYHTSYGHYNNRQTVLNLQAKGIECNHLKRYILAHRCDACEAASLPSHTESQTQGQVKFKDNSASSDCHRSNFRLAKSTCRKARFGIQYNHRCH